jgi:four helix bundle protein
MTDSAIRRKSFAFALRAIKIYQRLREDKEYVISAQLLRSATSIGANVEEAQAAQSRRDFLSKMAIASKEARETRYWLKLLSESGLARESVENDVEEVNELIRILTSIVKTTGERK